MSRFPVASEFDLRTLHELGLIKVGETPFWEDNRLIVKSLDGKERILQVEGIVLESRRNLLKG